jgi:hypothetical protein
MHTLSGEEECKVFTKFETVCTYVMYLLKKLNPPHVLFQNQFRMSMYASSILKLAGLFKAGPSSLERHLLVEKVILIFFVKSKPGKNMFDKFIVILKR